MKINYPALIIATVLLFACSSNESDQKEELSPQRVSLKTNYGELVLELSDKTPQHRDNFVKLVEEGAFDSLLFHRVIEGFVIQGGDPDSKYAQPGDTLGSGGRDYKVPAEFDTTLFHKRGALGAARDGNPDRASSAMQFYIVQASTPIADSLFQRHEERINGWLKNHYFLKVPENNIWYDSVKKLMENEDYETYAALSDTLRKMSEGFEDFESYTIPESHQEVYREVGGTPHLDQNYTVFGEVTSGMAVVDSIAAMTTDSLNRPVEDVRILSARLKE